MGIVERIREIRAERQAKELADKLEVQKKLQEESDKRLQRDALEKLESANQEAEMAKRCAELSPLLDFIAGAREQLQEVSSQIWGGLGVIQDYWGVNWGVARREGAFYLGHKLTYEYKSALEEYYDNGKPPDQDKFGFPIIGTGRPATHVWSERIALWCEVSISVGVDSANRVTVGSSISDEPRLRAMSLSEQLSLCDREPNSWAGQLYADDQARSYATVQDMLAKTCMNVPPIYELKQVADERLRKYGFDQGVRAREIRMGPLGCAYRE